MTKKTYTTAEAAQILGVCEQRIRAKLQKGHFPNAIPPTPWQIPEQDLKKWIDRKQRQNNE